MSYDDLMGLDMYEDGMEGLYSAQMLKEQTIAAAASAASILLAAWGLPKLSNAAFMSKLDEPMRHRIAAGAGVVGGMALSAALWNKNRDAAMAILGGVSGLGLAQLIDSFFEGNLIGGGTSPVYPLGSFAAGDEGYLSGGDQALLAAYGSDNGSALSALEATSVKSSRGAFGGLGQSTLVNSEALMGFEGTVVASQTLGEDNSYPGYLS